MISRDINSKSNYFHFFALIAKFIYRYSTSNNLYEMSKTRVLLF